MQVLIDTDIFCKLGVSGLLDDAVVALGIGDEDLARLPALPHMLRRGSLVKRYGVDACSALISRAQAMPVVGMASEAWLEQFVKIPSIDAGEAQLLAVTAEQPAILLSGDKRALRAVAKVPGFADAVMRRIIVFEAVLLALCRHSSPKRIRSALQPLMKSDQMVKVCFSAGNSDPIAALWSYFLSLEAEVYPLNLWHPPS